MAHRRRGHRPAAGVRLGKGRRRALATSATGWSRRSPRSATSREASVRRDEALVALGVDSAEAAEVAARLHDWLARPVPLRLFREHPTIEALARALSVAAHERRRLSRSSSRAAAFGPIRRRSTTRSATAGISRARQLLTWAGDRLAPGLPVFVEGGLLHIRGRLDPGGFQRAFQGGSRRIRRAADGHRRRRRVAAAASSAARRIDARDGRPVSRRGRPRVALEELARERMATALGGSRSPPSMPALVRMRPEHHVWVLVQHQLISDAWSFRLVHRRMVDHYQREQHGRGEADIPPQFHEYIAYERHYRASPQHRRGRAYWQSRMSRVPVRPAAVHSRGVGGATRICRVSHRLGRDTTAALRRLAGTQSASPDMGLFIVFASLMAAHVYRTTGTQDVILSVPFANRPSRALQEYRRLLHERLSHSRCRRTRRYVSDACSGASSARRGKRRGIRVASCPRSPVSNRTTCS